MKAKIEGMEIEGTASEIMEVIKSLKTPQAKPKEEEDYPNPFLAEQPEKELRLSKKRRKLIRRMVKEGMDIQRAGWQVLKRPLRRADLKKIFPTTGGYRKKPLNGEVIKLLKDGESLNSAYKKLGLYVPCSQDYDRYRKYTKIEKRKYVRKATPDWTNVRKRMSFIRSRGNSLMKQFQWSYEKAFKYASDEWKMKFHSPKASLTFGVEGIDDQVLMDMLRDAATTGRELNLGNAGRMIGADSIDVWGKLIEAVAMKSDLVCKEIGTNRRLVIDTLALTMEFK